MEKQVSETIKHISIRTKEALAAKKARGEALCVPDGLNDEARIKSLVVRQQKAKEAVYSHIIFSYYFKIQSRYHQSVKGND